MYNSPYQTYPYQNNYGVPNYMQRGYNAQAQQMAQPQTQIQQPIQSQPPMAQQTPQIQEIRYGTEEEAKAFIVFPNCIAYFIDYAKNRLYAKSANPSGISNIDYFSLIPINADGSPIKPQEPIPQVNFDEFIKKEDLEKLGFVTLAQYNELAQKMEQIQKRLEGARTNVGQPKQSAETRM
jgi:hypothetical protein